MCIEDGIIGILVEGMLEGVRRKKVYNIKNTKI